MKKLIAMLCAMAMAVSLAGCGGNTGGGTSSGGGTPAGTGSDDVIRIGELSALTGDIALVGWAEQAGAELAVKEINEAGGIMGKQVELYIEDTAGDDAQVANATRRLIEEKNVNVIIGPQNSGGAYAATPLCAQANIPLMTTTATNAKVTVNDDGSLNEWTWRWAFTDPYQGKILADYAAAKLGLMRTAIISDVGSDYAEGLIAAYKENYALLGGEIVSEQSFKTNDVDFRAQLTNLKNVDFDVLFFPNGYKELALVCNQLVELGFDMSKIQIMAGDSAMSANAIPIAGENLVGTYLCTYFSVNDEHVREVIEKVKTATNTTAEPEPNCVIMYDMIYWFKDVVERAGSLDGTALQKAINETDGLELTIGTMTMDPETHNPKDKEAAIIQYQPDEEAGAKQVFLEMYEPSLK